MSGNDEKSVDSDEDYCVEGDIKSSEDSDTSSDESSNGFEMNKKKKNVSCLAFLKTRQSNDSKNKFKIEKDELPSDEEADKSRSDALWADFLSDVGSSSEKHEKKMPVETMSCGSPKNLDITAKGLSSQRKVEKRGTNLEKNGIHSKGAVKRPSRIDGVGSLINILGKKKKISVLEKSQMDWNTFKSNEGIDEELRTHNKGKEGYLERQDFLQRTDLRQFEIEKSLRQSRRNN
ncbi:hypothetical protein KR074_003076 [Drosophila pseudoananassae]|nr:hypothetical protein KR074_003076 [Drosophila pseudoananassae]